MILYIYIFMVLLGCCCDHPRYPPFTDWTQLASASADFAVLGVPNDMGTQYRSGARMGPRGIREASTLYQFGHKDRGARLEKYTGFCFIELWVQQCHKTPIWKWRTYQLSMVIWGITYYCYKLYPH